MKAKVTAGGKGGRKGRWSARKAQLAVADYKKAGGGYVGEKRENNSYARDRRGIVGDDGLPEMARDLFRFQAREYAAVESRLEEIETKLMKWHREDDVSRRVATIPGIGPIGSIMLSMKAPPPESFRSGRDFAAWIGLTPGIIPPAAA